MRSYPNFQKVLPSQLFVQVSDIYYNKDQNKVLEARKKQRTVKTFLKDIKEGPAELPFNTPSAKVRLKGKVFNITNENPVPAFKGQEAEKKKPEEEGEEGAVIQSMHDICSYSPSPKRVLEDDTPHRVTSVLPLKPFRLASISTRTPKPQDGESGSSMTLGKTPSRPIAKHRFSFLSPFQPPPQAEASPVTSTPQKKLKFMEFTEQKLKSMLKPELPLCSLCSEQPANGLFSPCHHGGICTQCATKAHEKMDKKCPICRGVSQDSSRLSTPFTGLSAKEGLSPRSLRM